MKKAVKSMAFERLPYIGVKENKIIELLRTEGIKDGAQLDKLIQDIINFKTFSFDEKELKARTKGKDYTKYLYTLGKDAFFKMCFLDNTI